MKHNIRARLGGGETLLGTMITLPSPATAEILAGLGFDWLFVDGEHGPLETAQLLGILQAVGDKIACIVRVPAAEEVPIKKVLDLGAAGIIAPQVNTPEQAADVVRFSRYAPEGGRGVGLARAHGYGFGFVKPGKVQKIRILAERILDVAIANIGLAGRHDGNGVVAHHAHQGFAPLGELIRIHTVRLALAFPVCQ